MAKSSAGVSDSYSLATQSGQAACPTLSLTISRICSQSNCNRDLIAELFQKLNNVTRDVIEAVDAELKRGNDLKRHPHSCVYRYGLPMNAKQLDDDSKAYLAETRDQSATALPLRSYVIERTVDVIQEMAQDKVNENLKIIENVIEACLVYQIAYKSLIGLRTSLDLEMNQLWMKHYEYDTLLQKIQTAQSNNEEAAVKVLWAAIVSMQDELDQQKIVVQRLVNHAPFFVSRVRDEHDFMMLYGNVDDTVFIHEFLTKDFVQNEIQRYGSPTLKNAYSKIKHKWTDFLKR